MNTIPQKVVDALQELNLTKDEKADAGWFVHKSYVLRHKTCEKLGALKDVRFDPPVIIESDAEKRICVLSVTGHMGNKFEWSIGEATPLNLDKGKNIQKYPYAMAEKRAKDRVILKLVGLHGDAYSEAESDEFAEQEPESKTGSEMLDKIEKVKQNPIVKETLKTFSNSKITKVGDEFVKPFDNLALTKIDAKNVDGKGGLAWFNHYVKVFQSCESADDLEKTEKVFNPIFNELQAKSEEAKGYLQAKFIEKIEPELQRLTQNQTHESEGVQ